MSKFRKKPVVIDAVQFDGTLDSYQSIIDFGCSAGKLFDMAALALTTEGSVGTDPSVVRAVIIPTLEGQHIASPGDWIIRGVKGEFYPCKPDVFALTYEAMV